jgi:hypothetical protein
MQPTIDVVHRSYTHSCTHLKQTNLICKMEEEDHRDDESIDGDEEVDGNSKNRVSK